MRIYGERDLGHYIDSFIDYDRSGFEEEYHFEKRTTDSILCFSCNQRFGWAVAFFCALDVSMVRLPSDAIQEPYSRD